MSILVVTGCESACNRTPISSESPLVIQAELDAESVQSANAGDAGIASVPVWSGDVAAKMVTVQGASFHMGSNDGKENERPMHDVTVKTFMIDMTEVRAVDYAACVKVGVCSTPETSNTFSGACNFGRPDRLAHPINCVTYHQARAFCSWMGKRLPTEAEWEYAARGRDRRRYPWGNDAPERQLCWNVDETCAVGQYPKGKSPFGILDMAGNVWEWTSDTESTYDQGVQVVENRIIRGGGYNTRNDAYVRTTVRRGRLEQDFLSDLGFRCARDPY